IGSRTLSRSMNSCTKHATLRENREDHQTSTRSTTTRKRRTNQNKYHRKKFKDGAMLTYASSVPNQDTGLRIARPKNGATQSRGRKLGKPPKLLHQMRKNPTPRSRKT
ncbi:hypothetical protein FRC07_004894, partial [Ceratobasidium sp. 392]